MRIAFIILITIHSLIHLFGFLKALGVSEFNAILQPVSNISGFYWLLTFLLFTVTIALFLSSSEYWWLGGVLALINSQILIINYWSDAKFGTIVNLVILVVTIVSFSNYNFKRKIKKERVALFNHLEIPNHKIINADAISTLPTVVQKWLASSGVIGKPNVTTVYLTQELELKLRPEQYEWNKATAEQYFTIEPPAFNWNINIEKNPFLTVAGRDKFVNGRGEMQIKLLSLITVSEAGNNKKMDQATLQRYLAEVVWFPSASLSPYIQWASVDGSSARATMEYKGTKASGVFYFDPNGYFKEFVAMRYKDANDTDPTKWIVTATKIEDRNGIKIPTECEVSWNLNTEQWTWLKLKINHIEYNVDEMPVVDKTYKN